MASEIMKHNASYECEVNQRHKDECSGFSSRPKVKLHSKFPPYTLRNISIENLQTGYFSKRVFANLSLCFSFHRVKGSQMVSGTEPGTERVLDKDPKGNNKAL